MSTIIVTLSGSIFVTAFLLTFRIFRNTLRMVTQQLPTTWVKFTDLSLVQERCVFNISRSLQALTFCQVKSQTPKVEKQEKPKQPKGRAYKRLLYVRRFVNVTNMVGGKRRVSIKI